MDFNIKCSINEKEYQKEIQEKIQKSIHNTATSYINMMFCNGDYGAKKGIGYQMTQK